MDHLALSGRSSLTGIRTTIVLSSQSCPIVHLLPALPHHARSRHEDIFACGSASVGNLARVECVVNRHGGEDCAHGVKECRFWIGAVTCLVEVLVGQGCQVFKHSGADLLILLQQLFERRIVADIG